MLYMSMSDALYVMSNALYVMFDALYVMSDALYVMSDALYVMSDALYGMFDSLSLMFDALCLIYTSLCMSLSLSLHILLLRIINLHTRVHSNSHNMYAVVTHALQNTYSQCLLSITLLTFRMRHFYVLYGGQLIHILYSTPVKYVSNNTCSVLLCASVMT